MMEQKYKLRPCVVKLQSEIQTGNKRKYETKLLEDVKAVFHKWIDESYLVGESCLRGGHSDGQVNITYGLVELEDGTIKKVSPTNIVFIDSECVNIFKDIFMTDEISTRK